PPKFRSIAPRPHRPRGRPPVSSSELRWRFCVGRWCNEEIRKYENRTGMIARAIKCWTVDGARLLIDAIEEDATEEFGLSIDVVRNCRLQFKRWQRRDKKHQILQWL